MPRKEKLSFPGTTGMFKSDCPLYPLDSPGMPVPGPDFCAMALAKGDDTEMELVSPAKGKAKKPVITKAGRVLMDLYRRALYGNNFAINLSVEGEKKVMPITAGHLWGQLDGCGPERAEVMVLGKMLGTEENQKSRNLIGPAGQYLLETLRKLGVKGMPRWYVTSLLKIEHPDKTKDSGTIKPVWIKEFLPLLHQELRLVQPKFILCLGADALKAITNDSKLSVANMEGRVVELKYPIHASVDDEPEYKTALVSVVYHPAYVLKANELQRPFEEQISRFAKTIKGERPDLVEDDIDHRLIDNEADLVKLIKEVRECKESYEPGGGAVIAVDAEWHGEHPNNAGAYMRTIQFSWAHKKAACIVLRHAGGAPAFLDKFGTPNTKRAIKLLEKVLKSDKTRKVRMVGQFLNADLEWLVYEGLDLREEFKAPETWQETRSKGGFDTGLAAHALDETADYKLEHMALRYVGCPRYDLPLQKWKTSWCSERKIVAGDLEGYGECPIEVLGPYGNYDADVTRRLYVTFQKLLDRDRFGNCCREAFWVSQRAAPSVLEIHQTGIMVDRTRVDELTETYLAVRTRLQEEIRAWAKWPEFNVNSTFHVREYLFGEELNGKRNEKDPTSTIRLRPKGARTLGLQPLFDTSKRPVAWHDVVAKGLQKKSNPGTNKSVLALLAQEAQEHSFTDKRGRRRVVDRSSHVNLVRNYRFISQVLKSTLRPPKIEKDPETKKESWVKDATGHWVYLKGLAASICDDGRVRTHMYQTKETGRWSSARPPMQNFAKQREKDYKEILGQDYKYPLRSILMASPGHALVEADFIGAELFGMAMMAGDPVMIDHCIRNQLEEHEPNYYDIHSNIAVFAFRLDCPATKEGLDSIGKKELRIVAKAVIFGIAYGRGAKAIALSAKEQGVPVSVHEAQQIIDAIFEMYPRLKPFFDECQGRALEPRWLCGPFGRFRRFSPCFDPKMVGDVQRQAMNFPIQGMIADAVSRAMDYLDAYRTDVEDIPYKIVLQVHDAVLLEVPGEHVPAVVDRVLPQCMKHSVPIYPATLDGMPTGEGPYHLGIDTDVQMNWGVTMSAEECLKLGFSPKYAKWQLKDEGWNHNSFDSKTHKRYWLPESGWEEVPKPSKN